MSNAQARQGIAAFRIPRIGYGARALLLLAALPASSQQTYITRFDVYAGNAYFNSPHVGLAERGVHLQTGFRAASWLSLGFDYSRAAGDLTLTPDLLVTSVQQQLTAQFAQLAAAKLLPAGYALAVPVHSQTQTFAGGPQLSYRRWKPVTLFIRPSIGAMMETATPHPMPGDTIAAGVVAQLAPAGYMQDRVAFYGFGGGADFNLSRRVALRVQADFVHDRLFDDLLKDSRNTVRVSVGPAFNFSGAITR
ncbi:MAG: hypothetical protein ABSC23_08295 [Bryobacteraceae bacterium]